MLWVVYMATATSQFVLAYAVQLWYFTPYEDGEKHGVPTCPLVQGYKTGIMYHLGSFAFGSFIIAVLGLIQIILGYIANKGEKEGNAAVAMIAKCLLCVITCFKKCMEFLNKNAYMDIAIHSSSFCWAAKNAMTVIFKNFPDIGVLNGACWIFQLAGVGAITSGGAGLVFLITDNWSMFNDPASDHYVSDPVLVVFISACLCA